MKKLAGKALALIVVIAILVSVTVLPSFAFTPNPQTEYARSFVALCEEEQWFINEIERILNAEQKTINTLTNRADLARIVSLGRRDCSIAGKIPRAIGELTELRWLFLSGNKLTNPIPAELYTLTKLQNIDLANNNYAGAIPAGFGSMPALDTLALRGNGFTGTVPADILAKGNMKLLDVSSNKLSGAMPEFSAMAALEYLAVSDNAWSAGEIPDLSTLAGLKSLSMWGCGRTGDIPASLWTLTELQILDLGANKLTGSVAGLSALTKIQLASLASNQLDGTLPALVNPGNITTLNLADNKLRGHVPANYADIDEVWLENNYLTGAVLSGLDNGQSGSGNNVRDNFCDGENTPQHRLAAAAKLQIYTASAVNIYTKLQNSPAKPLLAAEDYEVIVPPEFAGKITAELRDDGIYVTALEEIPESAGLKITIRIRDNTDSDYSKVTVLLTTDTVASGGGSGGGASPEEAENAWNHEPYINGFDGGTFRPNDPVTREQIAAIIVRALEMPVKTGAPAYSDVAASRWSAGYIKTVQDAEYMAGYGGGRFAPAAAMTRAELAAALVRIAEKLEMSADGQSGTFIDVAQNAWYYEYISKAVAYGLIGGYADGTFRPNAPVTRAEAVTMINRLLGRDPAEESLAGVASPFTDVQDAGYWAYWQILEASVGHEHKI